MQSSRHKMSRRKNKSKLVETVFTAACFFCSKVEVKKKKTILTTREKINITFASQEMVAVHYTASAHTKQDKQNRNSHFNKI